MAVALLIGTAIAWQMLDAIDGKADDLVRHARVDAWTTKQAETRSYQFLVALSERVAGGGMVSLDDVRHRLSKLLNAASLLSIDASSPLVQVLPGKQNLRADFTTALRNIETMLDGRTDIRGDVALLTDIKAVMAPWLAELQQLMTNLTYIRLELQKRDLANASRLINVNRFLLLVIIGVGTFFVTMLAIEAHVARTAETGARVDRERFQDFAEIASDWMWETDADLMLTFVSDQIEDFSGLPASSYLGLPVAHLLPQTNGPGDTTELDRAIDRRQSFRDLVLACNDDQQFLRISGNPVVDRSGAFLGFRGICADISAEVKREGRIRFLAEHDHLTGLPNRSFLQAQLRSILEGGRASDNQGTLLTLDLDGFKDINDTFGHDVGDALIIAVGERLGTQLRQTDMIARLGGDEFAIIHRADDPADNDAPALTNRLLTTIRQPLQVAGFELTVGTSIGMARFPADGTTVEDLMKAADLALYAAKAAGGNRAITYHPRMSERLQRKRRLEQDLKQALEDGGLTLHVQPQVDLATERVIGGEALLRWHHPVLGPIGPDVFIPIAEETGLILPIGRWVLETACRAAKQWSSVLGDGLIAVNVSPAQFTHQNLVREVAQVLDRTGLAPQNLELEITEGLLMRDHQLAITTLGDLDAMGVKLAIDDFGTGYSSLNYLKRFRVHKVKIDKAFVHDLEHDRGDHSIVRAVAMMSQAFGYRTIAEGVETTAQRDRLIALGCDQAQGYLYGRPQPIDEFFDNYACSNAGRTAMKSLVTVTG